MISGGFSSSTGIFIVDTDLIVRSWDPWLAQVTGIEGETARGKHLATLFPDLEGRGMLARVRRVVSEGVVEVLAPALHHYFIRCAPQSVARYFDAMQQRVTLAPLQDGQLVVGAMITIEDVTERLEREREAKEREPYGRTGASERMPTEDETVAAQAESRLLDVLTGALGDEDWQIRRAAASGLAQTSGPDVLARLLRALRYEYHNLNVINSAVQALALLEGDSIEPLSELLNDPDPELRMYATLALGMTRDRRAVSLLSGALQDPDMNVRYHAIEGLGRLRAGEATEALMAIAETRDFFLAFPALDALAGIGDPSVAARIVGLLDDELLRGPAVGALGNLGDESAVAPLAQLLNGPGAPAVAIAQALFSLHEHYERRYREGSYIADLLRCQVNSVGVANLLGALDQAQRDELRPLVVVLGWLEDPAVEQALARLLAQTDVRRDVIEALVRHGPRVTELLVGQLRAEDAEVRQAAVVALGRIGDGRAVPELTRVLTSDEELMIIAAGALARIGDREPFEALLTMLRHPSASVRQAVVSALNSLGHPDMAERIAPLLKDADPHVREAAIKVAGYFGYSECLDALLAACTDLDESVRRAAIEHLPYLDDARALPALLLALKSDTAKVRAAAARALGQVTISAVVPPLLGALDDADPWVRFAAARALGQHAAPEALDALAALARDDPAQYVRIAAIEALGEMGGARVVATLAPLVDAPEADVSRAALRGLGHIGHPDALAPLLAALRNPSAAHRAEAARALGDRNGATTLMEVDVLQWTAAADADATVVEAAVQALGHLGTPEAIAALITLTADPTRRNACVAALASLGEAQVEDVASGLNYPQPAVRRAVIDALAQMKRPHASALLDQALDHADPLVRAAACQALGRLGNRLAERKLAVLAHSDPEAEVRRAAEEALRRC